MRGFIQRMREKHPDKVRDLEESWEGEALRFAFSTYGFKIRGVLHVQPEQVQVETELPLAAMMFRGRLEQEFRETLSRVLAADRSPPSPTSGD
jgi:hypothetical protein